MKRKCLHISFSPSSRDDMPFPSRGMSSLSIVSIDLMLIFTQKSQSAQRREESGEQSDSVLWVNSSALYPKMFAA